MNASNTIQISAESPVSFGDAMRRGLEQARETLRSIKGAWIADQKVMLEDGKLKGFRVELNVSFSGD